MTKRSCESAPSHLLLGDVLRAPPLPNVVKRHLLLLYDERLLQARPEQVHHLPVHEVVDDVLDDGPVVGGAKGPEDYDDRHLDSDVGQGGADLVALDARAAALIMHLKVQGGGGAGAARG